MIRLMINKEQNLNINKDGLSAILCPTMVPPSSRIEDKTIRLMYELFMFLTLCYPDFLEKNDKYPTLIVIF